jgi:NADH pyrophosphatase NudC (nudix superfamily)
MEWSDLDQQSVHGAVEKLLAREVKEESGLTIDTTLTYLGSVGFIRPDGTPVITPMFCARYLEGDVVLEENSFTDYAWVNAAEVGNYDCLGGVADEIRKAIHLLAKSS